MKLSAQFDFSQLDHTQDNTVRLVVSLEAPAIDWVSQRPKVCIFPVIDASGSMRGDKLAYAKTSVRKLIEQLAPGDFAGLGVLESKFHVRVPPQIVTPEVKSELLRAVDQIVVMGGTNFSDTLRDTLSLLKGLDLPLHYLHRVILFTDGQPTEGIVDQKVIKKILEEGAGRISVSFFGYGETSSSQWSGCDHAFLTELSQIGKGNYAYVQNPDDSLAAFGKELGGLLSTYASDIKLSVTPAGGHAIARMVTNVPYGVEVTGEYIVDAGGLLAEETRNFVFDVVVKAQGKAFPRETKIMDVEASFLRVTPTGKEVGKLECDAKARFVRKGDAQGQPDPALDKIVALHQMVRAQLDAEEQAKQGRFKEAEQIMVTTSNQFVLRGQSSMAEAARRTGRVMRDRLQYSSNQGYLRSMQHASRGTGASAMTADASAILSELGVALSNSSQEAYTSTFTAPELPSNPKD